MQLFVANVKKISLKTEDSILHGHGQENKCQCDANKSAEEKHKWQFWAKGNDHDCNDAQNKLCFNFILQILIARN